MAEGHTPKGAARRSDSDHSSEYLSISEESLTGDTNNDTKRGKESPTKKKHRTKLRSETRRVMSEIRGKHQGILNTRSEHTSVKTLFGSASTERGNPFRNSGHWKSMSNLDTSSPSATSNQFQLDHEWDFTGMGTHAFVDTNFRFVTITPSSSLEDQASPTKQEPVYRDMPSTFDNWSASEKDFLLQVMAMALASKAIVVAQEELLVLYGQYPYTLNRKISSAARDPAIVLPSKKTLFRKFSQKLDKYKPDLSYSRTGRHEWIYAPEKYIDEKSPKSFAIENKIDTARGIPLNGDLVTTSSREFVHRDDSFSISDQGISVEFVKKKIIQPFFIPSDMSTIATEDSYESIDDVMCSTKRPYTCNRLSDNASPNQSTVPLARATAKTAIVEDQISLASCSYYLETNYSELNMSSAYKTENSRSRRNETHGVASLRIRKCQPKLVLSDSFSERNCHSGLPGASASIQYDTPNERQIVETNSTSKIRKSFGGYTHEQKHLDDESVLITGEPDDDTNSELNQSQLHIASLQRIPQICLDFNAQESQVQESGSFRHRPKGRSHPNEKANGIESQSRFQNTLSQFLDYGQRSRRHYGRSNNEIHPMSDTNVHSRRKSGKSSGSRRMSEECNLGIREDVMPYDPGIRSASQTLETDRRDSSDRIYSGQRNRPRARDVDSHRRPRKPDYEKSRHRKTKPKVECTNCRQPISSEHGTLPGESYCSDSSTCRSVSPPLTLRSRDSGVRLGVVLVKSSTSQRT